MKMPMNGLHLFLFACFLLVSNARAVDAQGEGYDEFGQDNLYHDYALRQQEKEAAVGG